MIKYRQKMSFTVIYFPINTNFWTPSHCLQSPIYGAAWCHSDGEENGDKISSEIIYIRL